VPTCCSPDMFGWCVQAAAAGTSGIGTTVVGPYGYMAPEQFRGAASPASDLYGLGGTLLFLLSGAIAYTAGTFFIRSTTFLVWVAGASMHSQSEL
jgi:serine/threonine protein kinase